MNSKNMLPLALVALDHAEEFAVFQTAVKAAYTGDAKALSGNAFLSRLSEVSPGVVTIEIAGMIGFAPEYALYGGTSLDLLQSQLEALKNNDSVKCVILKFFSPGGEVLGVQQTAQAIRALSAVKPVYAWSQTYIASAAYWLASACTKIYTDGDTASVGSIGIYSSLRDLSGVLEKDGVKVHEFVSGIFKALRSPFHAPSEAEKAKMQEQVDTLFKVFTTDVANYRGVSLETVLQSADGQMFFAADAQSRGLTDGQFSFKELLMSLTAPDAPVVSAATPTGITLAGVSYASVAEAGAAFQALSASLQAATSASLAAETAANTAQCAALYASALGRAPEAAETAAFVTGTPEIRSTITNILKSAETSRLALVKAAGLTAMSPDIVGTTSAELHPLDAEAARIVSAGR